MKRFGAATLTVLIGGAGVWLAGRAPTTDAPPPAPTVSPFVDNVTEISTLADDRAKRQLPLAVDGNVVHGDGFVMPEAGTLEFTSFNGARLTQRFDGASVVGSDGAARALARQATTPVTGNDGKQSHARYPGFVQGLDLEYRFDGRDIEEFFHVDDTLRQDVVRGGGELVLKTVFPGLDKKNAAVRPLRADPPDPSKLPRNGVPTQFSPMDAPVDGRSEVLLFADKGRFNLPAAVAIDGADHRIELQRHFEFTKNGLEVAVTVPASWLATAEGRVIIDPSIIDNRRTINLNDGNASTSSIVMDSIGRLHVVYTAVYNGNWAVAYSTSATRGTSWTRPSLVFSTTSAVYYSEPPTLAIDSQDSLHVAWSMYGDISGSTDIDTTAGNNYGSLVHYARCADGCSSGNWQSGGQSGGRVLTPDVGAHPYQFGPRLAIDRDDTAHIMFMSCTSGCRLQYITIDRNEVLTSDLDAPGSYLWDYTFVIDGTNTPSVFWNDYRCFQDPQLGYFTCRSFLTRTIFDPSVGGWVDAGTFDTRRSSFTNNGAGTCGSDSYSYAFGVSGSVSADGRPHVTFADYTSCNGYFPAHVAFDPTSKSFVDATFIETPNNSSGNFIVAENILTTTDREGDLHAVWSERRGRNSVLHAQKPQGGTTFGTAEQLLRAGNSSLVRLLRTTYFPATMRTVDGDNLSMVVVFGGNSLQYLSTGAPLDAPIIAAPRNHSYVDTLTPLFSWQKLRNDTNLFDYVVEVDESPLFNTPALTTLRSNRAATVRFVSSGALTMRDNGCYYWHVRAENTVGSGPFSEPFEFCVDTTPPLPAQLIAPADRSDPGTRTPTFVWQPAKP